MTRVNMILYSYYFLMVWTVLESNVSASAATTIDSSPDGMTNETTSSHENSNTEDEFCKGMSMSMFMDGMHRSMHKQQACCLIYFVSGWVLDDRDKFKGAMMFSFLLALLMELLSALRGTASHYVRKPVPRTLGLTFIYALQSLLGYLLMFLAMTFSVEIILSTIAGLCVGNLAFFRYEDFQPHRKRRGPPSAQRSDTNRHDRDLREPLLSSSS